jgi:hypothetical protein
MKIEVHSLRVFKCLHKSFYELERLKHNLRYDHTKVVFNTFYYGGYRQVFDDFRKTVKKYDRLDIKGNSTNNFLDNIPLSKQIGVRLKRKLGALPFGYRNKNGEIVIEEREAQIVSLVFSYFIRNKSIHKTQKKLSDLGHDLGPEMVNKIVRDGFYAGLLKVRATHQPILDSITPIVDTKVFQKALDIQHRLPGERENYNPYARHESMYLLNRFITNSKTNTYYCGFRGKKASAPKFNHYYRIVSGKSITSHFTKTDFEKRFEEFLFVNIGLVIESVTQEHLFIIHNTIEKSIQKLRQSVVLKLKRVDRAVEGDGNVISSIQQLKELDSTLEFFSSKENFACYAINFMNNIEETWREADITLKRDIQFTLYPYGLRLDQDKGMLVSVLSLGDCKEDVLKRIESQKPLFH